MADFAITIYVEGNCAQVGGGAQWLGRTLSVALTKVPQRAPTPLELDWIRKLLAPWYWTQIRWEDGSATAWANKPTLIRELDTYLDTILVGDLGLNDPRLRLPIQEGGSDDFDDSDEIEPNWPGLLSQLGRLGSGISGDLRLATVESWPGALTDSALRVSSLLVSSIVPDGEDERFPNAEFEVGTEIWIYPALPADPAATGLIDHATRLVRADPEDQAATSGWLAELPARLGRALDPLARYADILEGSFTMPEVGLPSNGWTNCNGAAGTTVIRLLKRLLSPDTLTDILASLTALAGVSANADIQRTFVAKWQSKLTQANDPSNDLAKLLFPDPAALAPWDCIRNYRISQAFLGNLGNWLTESVPAAPDPDIPADQLAACRNAVTDWLGRTDNIDVLFNDHCPEALARRNLLGKLIDSAATDQSKDYEATRQAFSGDHGFLEALMAFDLGGTPPVVAGIVETASDLVFALKTASVDAAVRDGLPFRVDALFSSSDPEIHTRLDGYLVAICALDRSNNWTSWILASEGLAQLEAGDRQGPEVKTCTPLPVIFQSNSGGKSRIAAENYRGHALMPRSRDIPVEQEDRQLEKPAIGIAYHEIAKQGLPALAYGQTYRIMRGYQAPGGILPVHFCKPVNPLVFDSSDPDGAFVSAFKLGRTQLPGAPRVISLRDGKETTFMPPDGKETRPLWREHVALWDPKHANDAESLFDAPTVFLDPLASVDNRSFNFGIRAPALSAAKSGNAATGDLVRQYWLNRDAFWRGEASSAASAASIDDPAVVGAVREETLGKGGMAVRLWRITRENGLEATAVWQPVRIAQDMRIEVVVKTKKGTDASLAIVGSKIEVELPAGQRFVLEMATMVDKRFFFDGDDARFDKLPDDREATQGELEGCLILTAQSRIVFECLPAAENYLPAPDSIWRGITVAETSTGEIVAAFEGAAADCDFIGELRPVWQTWRWDGGPVRSWDHADYALVQNTIEGNAATTARSARHLKFEDYMFADRGKVGATAECPCTAGRITRLFALESLPNRGADYLRIRLEAGSRYQALRSLAVDNSVQSALVIEEGSASDGTKSPWRAYPIAARRRDVMPTPGIALAAPLFGSAGPEPLAGGTPTDPAKAAAGGIALYLDHPMYDTRNGGGLADWLEVRIVYEVVEYPNVVAALAIGADPIGLESEGWEPFEKKLFERVLRDNPYPAEVLLQARLILGQTLEPNSPDPQFPYAVAFVDPVAAQGSLEAIIRPDAMARITVRRTARKPGTARETRETTVLNSDWSQPLWVQFLADSGDGADLTAKSDGAGNVVVGISAEANKIARSRFDHLLALASDNAPDQSGPYLVNEVHAVLLKTVIDAGGKSRFRPQLPVKVARHADTMRFTIDGASADDAVRLIVVQRVGGAGSTGGHPGWTDYFRNAAGEDRDAEARIVCVGPLAAIDSVPLSNEGRND